MYIHMHKQYVLYLNIQMYTIHNYFTIYIYIYVLLYYIMTHVCIYIYIYIVYYNTYIHVYVYRGHTNPPHPHTSDLINLNDLNCSEESSVLRAFSELLHLINSNLNL